MPSKGTPKQTAAIPKTTADLPTKAKVNRATTLNDSNTPLTILIAVPPDGGSAWLIVVASFFCNFVMDGSMYSFGTMLPALAKAFDVPEGQVTLVGSCQVGTYLLCGPIISAIVNRFGFRPVAVTGALIGITGGCLNAFRFLLENIYFAWDAGVLISTQMTSFVGLIAFYGVIAGLGFGMIYSPSVIIIGYYFEKYRAISTGIAVCGSSIGTLCLSPLFSYFVHHYGWQRTFQMQAGLIVICLISAMFFKPLEPTAIPLDELDDRADMEQLDDNLDGVSDTSSNIEFHSIFGAGHKSTVNVIGAKTPSAKTSEMSRRATTTSFRSRFEAIVECNSNSEVVFRSWKSWFSDHMPGCCTKQITDKDKHVYRGYATGPMNRQDIFYSGSVVHLPQYVKDKIPSRKDNIDYRLSALYVGRAHKDPRKCTICPRQITQILHLLFDVALLKSRTLQLILASSFVYNLGLYVPYIFIANKAAENGISKDITVWMVSIIAISNTGGRICAGISSFIPTINPVLLASYSAMIAGISTMLIAFIFTESVYFNLGYCIVFGFNLAFTQALRTVIVVKYLGLRNLTNAFGLSTLAMGISALTGSPFSGFIKERTGDYRYAFLFSGCSLFLSGALYQLLKCVHRREMRNKRNITFQNK